MTPEILFILALVVVASALLITDRLRPDLVAVLLLVVLGLTGLVSPQDLFSGFSRSVVITIIALFIITAALERTGATRILGAQLSRLAGAREARAVTVVMVAAALLSLAMNTIGAAAVLLPPVIGMTRHGRLRPSKLLMPLSFGALLGGMATLFTTANLLVSAALADHGLRPYSVLDFLPVGLPMAIAGIAFMAVIGQRLLPDRPLGGQDRPARPGQSLSETYGLVETVSAAYVRPGSAMAGLSLSDGGWGERLGLNVVGISRGGTVKLAPARSEEVIEGDVILFTGHTDDEELERFGLIFTQEPGWRGQFSTEQVSLMEVVLSPRSSLAGKTLRETYFRDKYELSVLAIWREGTTIREGLADIPLRFGDALLLQGRRSRFKLLRDERDFIVLEEDTAVIETPHRAWLAAGLTGGALALAATNVLPIAEATFSVACLMVVLKLLSMDEAYSAIDWKTIFLIAGMIPLSLAIGSTGTATLVGTTLTSLLGGWGPLAVAGGIFLLTLLLAQVMGGQATAVVVAPIAIAAAEVISVDPRGLAMAVAMGCSTAFLTPFGHPANMLVMGPGGYSVRDYFRIGLPLTGLLLVVVLAALAWFWNIR